MLEVLSTGTNTAEFELGRQVVASLLNAYAQGSTYPLTAAGVVDMFNEVWSTGQYRVNSTASWSRAQVIAYLQSVNGTS
jgi:hypothetical protein